MDWKITAVVLFAVMVIGPIMMPPTMMGTDTKAGKSAGLETDYAAKMYSKCMYHTKPGHNRSFGTNQLNRAAGCKCLAARMDGRLSKNQIFQAGVIFDQTFETQRKVGQKLVMQNGVNESMGEKSYRLARKTARTLKSIFNYCRTTALNASAAKG